MRTTVERYRRQREARRFFYRLYRGTLWPDFERLVDLAVDYWERPERFK